MYRHLNREDRVALATLLREGYSQNKAACSLGIHPSTVSRELRRNSKEGGGYHAWNANIQAHKRRMDSKRAYRLIENNDALRKRIEEKLNPLVSPEVVAHEEGIHHESIYAWIYRSRPDLKPFLPQRGRKRRRYGSKREKKQGWTRNVRSIDERPESGISWEGDTIRGKGKARVLTHVERESLYTMADLIPDGTADVVHAKLKKNGMGGTITYDRGSEFALWKMIERDTDAEVFFAHPHAPWERGKNENTNGRLRRVFPKGFDFSTITQKEMDQVVDLMNHTKRKSLGWRTPAELYEKRCCTST